MFCCYDKLYTYFGSKIYLSKLFLYTEKEARLKRTRLKGFSFARLTSCLDEPLLLIVRTILLHLWLKLLLLFDYLLNSLDYFL